MIPPPPTDPKKSFRSWLRHKLWIKAKVAGVLLAAGCVAVLGLDTLWSGFGPYWSRLNYQLTYVALEQHPVALIRTFANRLGDSEYGWGLFSLTDPAAQKQRAAAYLERYQHIEARRFSRLYQPDDPFNPTDSGTKLARMITKIFGVPDALLYTIGSIVTAGMSGLLLFSTVLALAAVALSQSHRPARWWLKLLVWPTLASTLIWLAIVAMSVSAAIFGGLTPNTSALALFTTLPFLFLAAQLPLRYAESLVHVTPKPAKWDGIDRRKPRPAPGETTPPMGGA